MCKPAWANFTETYPMPQQDYMDSEIAKMIQSVKDFCDISGIDFDRIHINAQALADVIIRVDMRRLYFKIYHKSMNVSEYKITCALTVFWILKLHPFWVDITEEDDEIMVEVFSLINEKLALHMIIMFLNDFNPKFFDNGQDLVKSYYNELLYSFRYRDLSKESLFLMFDPFYYLHFFESSIDKEGNELI